MRSTPGVKEELYRDKHSSLFVSYVSDEEKKFYNIDTRSKESRFCYRCQLHKHLYNCNLQPQNLSKPILKIMPPSVKPVNSFMSVT
jgi:hypothetical protein